MHKKPPTYQGKFGKSEGLNEEKGGFSRKYEQIVTIQEQKSFGQNGESERKDFFRKKRKKGAFLDRPKKAHRIMLRCAFH